MKIRFKFSNGEVHEFHLEYALAKRADELRTLISEGNFLRLKEELLKVQRYHRALVKGEYMDNVLKKASQDNAISICLIAA